MAENIYDEIEIEDMTYDPALQIYHYPCPCGDRFEIAIADLRENEDIAVCPSCSLMIRVIFEVVSYLSAEFRCAETFRADWSSHRMLFRRLMMLRQRRQKGQSKSRSQLDRTIGTGPKFKVYTKTGHKSKWAKYDEILRQTARYWTPYPMTNRYHTQSTRHVASKNKVKVIPTFANVAIGAAQC